LLNLYTNSILHPETLNGPWAVRREPRNFQNKTLVARRREHFQVFLAIFLVAQLSPKRGVLVQKNSLASCQRCRHSVEPRALTCPFKHSDLIGNTIIKCHCWRRPQGHYFFYDKDIKQEIVHTILLEEYGVSKKWVIIMDRRQDLNVTSTPAGKSGPSAQDRYCAKGLGGGAKKRRANEKEQK